MAPRTGRAQKKPAIKTGRGPEDSTRLAKAMSHPLRFRILMALNDGTASPKDLADELGEPLGNVAYHVRTLLDLDCIELVDTAQRRGAIEHYYRATNRAMLDDAAWASLPPTVRRGFSAEWFKKAFDDIARAIDAGTFANRTDGHLSYTALALDEKGWQRLSDGLAELLEEALESQAKAAPLLAKEPGKEIRARLTMVQYEAAPGRPERKRK